jgi:hypothetical protein
VRVANVALDRYEHVQVTFRHQAVDPECLADGPDTVLSREFLEQCVVSEGYARRIIFGEHAPIRTDVDGGLLEWGIFLEIPYGEPTVVSATVRDPCARNGFDAVVFPGGE